MLLTSSNKLLGRVPGCDGLKTGYFYAGGFSTTVTAQRDGRRVIAVILGCKDSKVRDAKAAEWIEGGFAKLPPLLPPSAVVETNSVAEPIVAEEEAPVKRPDFLMPILIILPVVIAVAVALIRRRRTIL